MFTVLIVLHVLLAAGLIAIVLVQRGPGATMGAAFGAGASGTVFGSRGAGNFLTRTTSWLAVGFFGISLALAVLATGFSNRDADESVLSGSLMEQQATTPAAGESGSGSGELESAIDELDNPAAEPQAGAVDDAAQPEEAVTVSSGENGTSSE